MPLFERYTVHAKRAVYFARFEALHRQKTAIGAEDLLLGLTWDAGSRADRCADLKNRAVQVRALLRIPHLPSTATPYNYKADIPADDSCKKMLAYASFEADRRADYWIDTDHLLRAALRFNNPARDALESVGVTLPALRASSRVNRREIPAARVPAPKFLKYWLIHNGLVLVIVVAAIIGAVHWFINS